MAGFVNDATANAMLDAAISGTVYLGLYVGDPEGAGTEVSGNNYARAAVTFAAAASRAKASDADATFPTPSGSWGTVDYLAVFEADTGGTPILGGPATASKTIGSGDTVKASAGNLVLSIPA